MKPALVAALLLTGCLDESPRDEGGETSTVFTGDVARVELASVGLASEDEPDLCALATELARDNVCSLICDPEHFVARLIDGGMSGGRCYQLRCELGDALTVNVGVCIP